MIYDNILGVIKWFTTSTQTPLALFSALLFSSHLGSSKAQRLANFFNFMVQTEGEKTSLPKHVDRETFKAQKSLPLMAASQLPI